MDPSKRRILGRIAELKARSKRERLIATGVSGLLAALVLAETFVAGAPDETLVWFVPLIFYLALLVTFRTEQLKDLQMIAEALGLYDQSEAAPGMD